MVNCAKKVKLKCCFYRDAGVEDEAVYRKLASGCDFAGDAGNASQYPCFQMQRRSPAILLVRPC